MGEGKLKNRNWGNSISLLGGGGWQQKPLFWSAISTRQGGGPIMHCGRGRRCNKVSQGDAESWQYHKEVKRGLAAVALEVKKHQAVCIKDVW